VKNPYKDEIRAAMRGMFDKLQAPDIAGLPRFYAAKRKQPDRIGRRRLQWCMVRRDALTLDEINMHACAAIRRGNFFEAYGLLAERDQLDTATQHILDIAEATGHLNFSRLKQVNRPTGTTEASNG